MYTLLRRLTTRELLFQQLPALGGSFLIAELFYKFGSFGLEALAFLATWLVLDAVVQTVSSVISRVETRRATPAGFEGSAYLNDGQTGTRVADVSEPTLKTASEQPNPHVHDETDPR